MHHFRIAAEEDRLEHGAVHGMLNRIARSNERHDPQLRMGLIRIVNAKLFRTPALDIRNGFVTALFY